MKEEIKEILDYLKDNDNYIEDIGGEHKIIGLYEAKILLDYITNLQTIEQQYSAILSENAELENKITNLQKENEMQTKIISDKDSQLKDLQLENHARQEEMVKMGRENSDLRIQISAREEEYMKLQEENKRLKNTLNLRTEITTYMQNKIEKALEYAKTHRMTFDINKFINLLQGKSDE